MKRIGPTRSLVLFSILILVSLPLMSCGGGGGGGGEPASTVLSDSVQTGSVALLLTDGPTDAFSEINITITGVELLSEETRVLLFSGEKTLDLLELRDESSLFAASTNVPSLIYDKIRLQLSDIELVQNGVNGNPGTIIHPKLPGNGKLDLNPRTPFMVEPGRELILQIDLDAEKSIHIVQAGNGVKYIFRPVVFVDIVDGLSTGNLIRLEGVVSELDPAHGTFRLCQPYTAFQARTASHDDGYRDDADSVTEHCVTILTDGGTALFDVNGDPAAFSDLEQGDFVAVIGFFRTEGDRDDDLTQFDADVIEIGGRGAFLKITGTVLSSPDSQGTFGFLPASGEGIVGTVTVLVQPGAGIFASTGVALARSDIQTGKIAAIDGVLLLSNSAPGLLKAALVVLDMPETPQLTTLHGTALHVDDTNRTFDLLTADAGSICVSVPETALIFLEAVGGSLFAESEGNVPFETLDENDAVRVVGLYDSTGCLVADTIYIEVAGGIVIE